MFSGGRRHLGDSPRPKSLPASPAHCMGVMRIEDTTNGGTGVLLSEDILRENKRLKAEVAQLRNQVALLASVPAAAANNSEGRLRSALTSHSTTSEQLRQAINAVAALLEEARRELATKEYRDKRAAFEALHAASDRGDERLLPDVIAAARSAGVDHEDVEKAEARLKDLREQTDHERSAKAAKSLEGARKKEAFLLVKRNEGPALTRLLDSLGEETRWQDWKDHNGRTLWRSAHDLKALTAQAVLAPKLGLSAPMQLSSRSGRAPPRVEVRTVYQRGDTAPPTSLADTGEDSESQGSAPASPVRSISLSSSPQPPFANSEADKLKARALRAVVQDDGVALAEVLEATTIDVVAGWHNRAGTDLLTLCEERKSAHAYSVLAKALGMVREMKREQYEERETVWVYIQGDVQPKRATVLEETPEESDTVLIEYWDGDAPPERVERVRVRRMWS